MFEIVMTWMAMVVAGDAKLQNRAELGVQPTIVNAGSLGIATSPVFAIVSLPTTNGRRPAEHPSRDDGKGSSLVAVPILGPLTATGPVIALKPPTDDEVLRALERARPTESDQSGLPDQKAVTNVRIVKEKIADYTDPARVVPLLGKARLHHALYRCTVYFKATDPANSKRARSFGGDDRVIVVYVDHNHFHLERALNSERNGRAAAAAGNADPL